MAGIADNFKGLPIEDLIVSPIVGMAKGQAKLNDVTWKYISEVAFVEDEKTKKITARKLDVEMNRVMTNGDTGDQEIETLYSSVPISFSMEVKTSVSKVSSTDTKSSIEAKASGGFWGMKYSATVAGSVATHKENTRKTDNSAKYEVSVHAEQLPPTEGMLKLSDYLTQMLEPSAIPLTTDPNG